MGLNVAALGQPEIDLTQTTARPSGPATPSHYAMRPLEIYSGPKGESGKAGCNFGRMRARPLPLNP